jgi:hypothetical protein
MTSWDRSNGSTVLMKSLLNTRFRPFCRRVANNAIGRGPPLALQNRLVDLRLKARHATPTAIGCPTDCFRG